MKHIFVFVSHNLYSVVLWQCFFVREWRGMNLSTRVLENDSGD